MTHTGLSVFWNFYLNGLEEGICCYIDILSDKLKFSNFTYFIAKNWANLAETTAKIEKYVLSVRNS